MKNRGYDENTFIVSRKSFDVAHLPGIGKFCLCGCNRRIPVEIIKKNRWNKPSKFKNKQIFFSHSCKTKYYNKVFGRSQGKVIKCTISLETFKNGIEYRKLKLYLKPGVNKEFKITSKDKELWDYVNKIQNFRKLNSESLLTKEPFTLIPKQTTYEGIPFAR